MAPPIQKHYNSEMFEEEKKPLGTFLLIKVVWVVILKWVRERKEVFKV